MAGGSLRLHDRCVGDFVCHATERIGAAIGLWAPSCFHGYGQVMGGRLREMIHTESGEYETSPKASQNAMYNLCT